MNAVISGMESMRVMGIYRSAVPYRREDKKMTGCTGVTDFRFHDLRHDVRTKLLRQIGNLKLVQKALNHADIKSPTRYAHVLTDEVADALGQLQQSRNLTG